LKNNIIIVFSRILYKEYNQFDPQQLPFKVPETSFFYLDNPAFSIALNECTEEGLDDISRKWDRCMDEFRRLMTHVNSIRNVDAAKVFKCVRESRDKMKQQLHEVLLKIKALQTVQIELEAIERAHKQGTLDSKQYQNYMTTKTIKQIVLVDVDYHSTICRNCNHVCHSHCGLNEITEDGANQFIHCNAFGGQDNCTKCPKACSFTLHYHARKEVSEQESTIEDILTDRKAKYDSAIAATDVAGKKISSVSGALKDVEAAIAKEVAGLKASCETVHKHISGFNLADELSNSVQILKSERSSITNLKSRESADKFIAAITAIVDGFPSEGAGTGSLNSPGMKRNNKGKRPS
jgi:hypothetical protein